MVVDVFEVVVEFFEVVVGGFRSFLLLVTTAYLYTCHLRLLARDNQRLNLTSINGLWYISFGQNIYILGNLGYCCSHQESYSCGN